MPIYNILLFICQGYGRAIYNKKMRLTCRYAKMVHLFAGIHRLSLVIVKKGGRHEEHARPAHHIIAPGASLRCRISFNHLLSPAGDSSDGVAALARSPAYPACLVSHLLLHDGLPSFTTRRARFTATIAGWRSFSSHWSPRASTLPNISRK